MSLRSFHLFFIAISIILSGFVGFWSFSQYQQAPSTEMLALAGFCLVCFVGLIVYLVNFRKKTQKIIPMIFACFAMQTYSTKASACAVCFNPENEATRASINNAILFLLVVTALVLAGLTYFILKVLRQNSSKQF